MSFSQEMKKELCKAFPEARHCQLAELSGIFSILGSEDGGEIRIHTESAGLARKCYSLIRSAFDMKPVIEDSREIHMESEAAGDLLQALRIRDIEGNRIEREGLADDVLLTRDCCRRAFLRGVFLSAGSVSDPERGYHFEIVLKKEAHAQQLAEVMRRSGLNARTIKRKNNYIAYLKEGDEIVDAMNMMGAYNALMAMENARILKSMRNSVNRRVNCETANINKTVDAAVRQLEAIEYLDSTIGLSALPPQLKEAAEIRRSNPELSLEELGQCFSPPLGKSGVNHRLKRLLEAADKLER